MPKRKDRARDGIYTRKDRTGFWASWIDATGKRRQRKLDAPTFTQAKELLAAEKAAADKARTLGYSEPSKDTFAVAAKRFLKFQKARVKAEELEREQGIVDRHLQPHFGGKQLAHISRSHVERYMALRGEEVSAGTVIKEFNILKHLLSKAVEWNLIPKNPAHGIKPPRAAEGRTRYLSPSEFRATLEASPDWMRGPMALAAFTGMRRGEILGLRWKDLDLAKRRAYLTETKNGCLRVLALNGLAIQVLKSLPVGKPSELLFPDVDAHRLTVYTRRVLKSIGIEDASFHSFRHTAASWLIMEGVELYTVGQILGHKTPRMTQRYAHLSPEYMTAAVGKIDEAFNRVLPAPELSETDSIVTAE